MNKRFLKFFAVSFFIICLGITGVGLFYFFQMNRFINTPLNPSAGETHFTILPGQSLSVISKQLEADAIISDYKYFTLYVRIKSAAKRLQAGEYILSGAKSPEQILEILLKGKVKLHKTTIPEGWDIRQTARAFSSEGSCSETEFIGLCHDKSFISSLGINAFSLEGYLFPDTYLFPKKTGCKTIVRTMVSRFKDVFTDEMKDRAAEVGFSVHDTVIFASIIEKETGDASERPLISSVFHNRLKKDMRLESDPTVIYGIKDFDGNIKKKHLREMTPYNTYRIKGLPIGPIANPGEESLKAALYPEKSDYLFFVSKKDSTHYFSKTIQEHNRAVRKYQLRKR